MEKAETERLKKGEKESETEKERVNHGYEKDNGMRGKKR